MQISAMNSWRLTNRILQIQIAKYTVRNDANLFPGGILNSFLCNTVVHLTSETDTGITSCIIPNSTWLTTSLYMAAIPDHPDSAGYYIA
jgi:hypothetical protein